MHAIILVLALHVAHAVESKEDINNSNVAQSDEEILITYDNTTFRNFVSIITSKPTKYLTGQSTKVHDPDVGYINLLSNTSCGYDDIALSSQICETIFFRELVRNPRQSCLKLYSELKECMLAKWRACTSDAVAVNKRLVKAEVSSYDRQTHYLEARYCNDGALSLPSKSNPINYCSSDYNAAIGRCYKDYHRSFRQNPSSKYTCEKFHFARTCASSARSRMCYYSNILDEIHKTTETMARCWNPFCISSNKLSSLFPKEAPNRISFSSEREKIESRLFTYQNRSKDVTEVANALSDKSGIPTDCPYNKASLFVLLSVWKDTKQLYEMFNPNHTIKNISRNDIRIYEQELKKLPNDPLLAKARKTTLQSIADRNCANRRLSAEQPIGVVLVILYFVLFL